MDQSRKKLAELNITDPSARDMAEVIVAIGVLNYLISVRLVWQEVFLKIQL